MRVSDFSMLWTPKLDSVGGSYNGQLPRLHRQTGNTVLPRPSPIQTGAGEMAEPSTLAQMAINMANTDFVRRVTPHPQAVSPLQQLITEDQQAKGDPGDDEIEGLDAKVLLNADALEDSEPVMLDFEGQGEMPSLHPPHRATHTHPPPYSNHHQSQHNYQQPLSTHPN